MKLVCSVAVGNRILPSFSFRSQNKHVRSTLALCRHPKYENEYYIIHFTAQNKTGIKYNVVNNVSCILTRFINEGKATIQFKEPPHDLFIKADCIQLKGFLHLLQRALQKKISAQELTLSSMSVTAISAKNLPPTKLVVKTRSELPLRGFARTLEVLHINEIGLCKLPVGVLQLQRLRVLNLCENSLEFLPTELNRLHLEDLNIARNQLGKSTPKQWAWIGGPLLRSLKVLNLVGNEIRALPQHLVKLQALVELHVDDNELVSLPPGIGNFRNLRVLTASNNQLTQVPGSMKRLHLERLDISSNRFRPISVAAVFPKMLPIGTLKEYAARKVLQAKLPYSPSTVPWTVVGYLDGAFYCVCGRPCFEMHLHHANVLVLESITQSFVSNVGELNYVPMDCHYCSLRCFRRMAYPPV